MAELFDSLFFFFRYFLFLLEQCPKYRGPQNKLVLPDWLLMSIYETLTFWYSKHCIKRRSGLLKKQRNSTQS